jgi:hypothetical protein
VGGLPGARPPLRPHCGESGHNLLAPIRTMDPTSAMAQYVDITVKKMGTLKKEHDQKLYAYLAEQGGDDFGGLCDVPQSHYNKAFEVRRDICLCVLLVVRPPMFGLYTCCGCSPLMCESL